jgi:transcriptional regulator with XRE-family HTH domain
MDAAAKRRSDIPSAFGALLRHWRSLRRQSQLELALSTNVSQRHLSFLESGRAQPSRAMVLRLAEALNVPIRERNALLHAAGFSAVFNRTGLSEPAMAPVRDALELMLGHHDPYPALVVDRDWNLLMANGALQRLLGLAGNPESMFATVCGDGPRNVYRLSFHPAGLRPFIANWDEMAAHLLQRLARETAATGSDTGHALLEELLAYPDIPDQWQGVVMDEPLNPVLPLELTLGGLHLRLFSVIATFGTPQDVTTDELRIESFFPADDATARALRGMADN